MPKSSVADIKRGQPRITQNSNNSTVQLQTLRPRLVSPSEYLVPRFRAKNKTHRPEVIPGRGLNFQGVDYDPSTSQSENSLDGFVLLEAAGMTLPDDVIYAVLSGKRLMNVVEEDLVFFSNLLYLDLSENSVSLEHFKNLPNLMELRLSCNFIRDIMLIDIDPCFNNLLSLDLSYNNITRGSIESLVKLPRLKELDLSGNKLTVDDIPTCMEEFQSLEKLVLESNKLDAATLFDKLSTAPNLRDLHLAYNFLWKIPHIENSRVGFATQHSQQSFRLVY
jgi:Leucine-rich repeat (LRR) protein